MASSFSNSNYCSCSVLAKNWLLAHAKFACDWRPVAYKLYPSGRQSHINCTRVAASRMQIVPAWPPVACNIIKSPEICMGLAATRVQFACDWAATRQETSRQEVCKRPSLHHNCIFLALASPHPRPCFWLFSWRPLDIWFGKCTAYYEWQSHAEANFARASSLLRAKPPVFCKHAARTIIWIKKWRRHKKIWESSQQMSLTSAIHMHGSI